MMKKFKFLMLLALTLFLVGCRQLEMVQENEIQKQERKVSVIKNNDILKNISVSKEILKIQSEKFSKNMASKNIQDSILEGAIISTENVALVENGTQKTYTFPINRSFSSSKIENLVLKQNSDNSFSGVLIQYDITREEKELFISGHDVNLKNKMKVFEINKINLNNKTVTEAFGCFVITWEHGMCSAGVHSTGHDGGCTVGGAPSPVLVSIVNTCSGGGYSTGNDGIPPYPDYGSPSNGNTGYDTLPYSGDSDQMFALFQSFYKAFNLNSYSLSSDLRYKLFYLYLNGNQDSFTITAILQALKTAGNTPQNQTTLTELISELNLNTEYRNKFYQLDSNEKQEFFKINFEIGASPYDEAYVKETNEAFVAFTAYADIENMTDAQMETVLNQCCPSIIVVPQAFISEKVKLIATNYLHLRKLYPSWSKGKCFWNASKETIHLFLDIAGTVPVIGEVCDITNGFIYTIEGDGLNATLSYAGAIPIAGWGATGAKLAIKTVAGSVSLAVIKNADGFYVVSRNQALFRKVLGMVKGDGRIAHHIIPFALQTHPAVQKAMLSKNAFMINEALNGIPLSSAVHAGSHKHYSDLIENYLNNIPSNLPPDAVYSEIIKIIDKVKLAIKNNPNTPLNQLNF